MNEVHENHKEVLNKQMVKDAITAAALFHGAQSGISPGFLGRTTSLKIVPKNKYAPCPCGSGEKYKFCCGRNKREDAIRNRFKDNKIEFIEDKREVFTDGKIGLQF